MLNAVLPTHTQNITLVCHSKATLHCPNDRLYASDRT